ncbi:MAG TPA: heat-inducible transcriptional repressor HrcA [Candidatus Dormibacteraeota bacterium]|nr:heat-inducible transcriptional repressor HrcA [Candidatus Dormibacteraeota bacterium]
MRNAALQERRNRQILADIVRVYIDTGEPVSSRAISQRFEETLSTATIRNVMADLEGGGLLYQPHTSAGRVPTAEAYRFFAQEIASQATLTVEDRDWIKQEFNAASSSADMTERAGHVLAAVSNGLGIIVSPPLGKTVLEHARMWLLPDGRVVVVLISPGGITRDKILKPHRQFTQVELDATAEFLNRQYSGWTLESIRGDLLQKLATESERYEGIVQSALTLCDPAVLGDEAARQVHIEGTAQMIGATEFADQAQLRDLLSAIEEKHRLVTVLNACIDTPEPVHVQIGVKEMSDAGENLALISAPYTSNDLAQGTLGVLGPTRMHYERAMTAVAYVAQLFSEALRKI